MNDASLLAGGAVTLVVAAFLFVLAVLWFLLPFAVFGVKDLLRRLIHETQLTRAALDRVAAELRAAREPPPPADRAPPPPPGTRVEPTLGEIIERDRPR